ncbi:iron-sulfur cluster carrier protein ApbC [Ostreibacterium oceani]|uniref:Iron-sulfur cluster carrier protein n=1 Tax=Ostreibacterium oceani TaxID=2654998 RepID=A0A6N7ETP3_9GAMM|nr:iron-sulfur cluster carrier protein ApbC [Ostreibacterium oceani]MPV86184.1 iron-sulfur cluster carrier protein ApbC [Ostreibacterium oceani]
MVSINIQELENMALNADVTRVGDIAQFKQMGDQITVTLGLYSHALETQLEQLLAHRYPGLKVTIATRVEAKKTQPNTVAKKGVKNIIAVASGKGGVGKSSTAINLALALSQFGARVGLLDADIYGPSQPTMLGKQTRPEMQDDKTMRPVIAHGLQTNSIGYLVDGDSAMIWRGPMVTAALQQLLNDTAWDNVDYLLIDLPPGTGDIQLTMAQKMPITGAVVVTTPQDISLIDARRAVAMFNKMQIDNLGIIENMSTHICEQCGHESPIFGHEGGQRLAAQFTIPFLGDVPLDRRLRESLDAGLPLVSAEADHPISQRYRDIAMKIAIEIAKKPKGYSQAFGKIAVENKPNQ